MSRKHHSRRPRARRTAIRAALRILAALTRAERRLDAIILSATDGDRWVNAMLEPCRMPKPAHAPVRPANRPVRDELDFMRWCVRKTGQ